MNSFFVIYNAIQDGMSWKKHHQLIQKNKQPEIADQEICVSKEGLWFLAISRVSLSLD